MKKILQTLFTTQGRVNRKTYWLWSVSIYSVFLASVIYSEMRGEYNSGSFLDTLVGVILYVFAYIFCCLSIKRLHDTGRSSDGCLLSIPLIGPIFAIWLLRSRGYKMGCLWSTILWPIQFIDTLITCFFQQGIEKKNRYGEPPK